MSPESLQEELRGRMAASARNSPSRRYYRALLGIVENLGGDKEAAHGEADEELLMFLQRSGFTEEAESWRHVREVVGFWYA